MKILIILLIAFFTVVKISFAQLGGQERIDSLMKELPNIKKDTNAVNLYVALSFEFRLVNPIDGVKYGEKGFKIAENINWELGKAKCYNSLGLNYLMRNSNEPKALEYFLKALKINEDIKDRYWIAINLGNIGLFHQNQSDYHKALDYYHKALQIDEELGNKKGVARHLGNIGVIIYRQQSNFPKALEYFYKSLKIDEEIGFKNGVARNLGNIGIIYRQLADLPKALECYFKALKIDEELGNKNGIALHLGNIGIIYQNQSNYTKALEYYHNALKIDEELGNKNGVARHLGNIGIIYQNQSDYTKALEYFLKALEINEELRDKSEIARHHVNIGGLYLNQAMDSTIENSENRIEMLLNREVNLDKAIYYSKTAYDLLKEIGDPNHQSYILYIISQAYQQKGDYKNAYEKFIKHKLLQDSVFSIDRQKELANLDAKRELEIKEKENQLLIKDNELFNSELIQKNQKINLAEKEKELQHIAFLKEQAEKQEKEKQLSLTETQMKLQKSQIESLDKEKERQNAELKAKNLQRNFFIAGVIVFIILFLIAFIRFREKKKLSDKLAFQNAEIEKQKNLVENQKNIVEEQKEILQEKNEQIYSSINYAATIQHAILPWDSIIKTAFPDILIFYKPKDIVSGDSYWFKEIDGIKFLAVIDCTGHGIPGAMLTVIASTALDDAVLGKRLTDTAQILTYMNEKVTEVLNQRLVENSIRDGMEVALIAIHNDKIQFSGAGRPLYMKNSTMEIIKIDKRGIAGQTDNDEYQFSAIEIEKSDNIVLYLTSDGFADQMNEQSKKYSTKRFVSLLDSISEKPISEQKEILENEFNNHKGERSQIDDVTILGVRV